LNEHTLSLAGSIRSWWREQRQQKSLPSTFWNFLVLICEFLRDSVPQRRRLRYGDIDYDWEQRVDTTSANLRWRTRLLGLLASPYQPIPPEQFHEMMAALTIDCRYFTFIDVGSGKGRALLLASQYGFGRIIGIELLPELHRIAEENVSAIRARRADLNIELVCMDATNFAFPAEPTVVLLFNPLPDPALCTLIANLHASLLEHPRPFFVLYANPLLEERLARCPLLIKFAATQQYSLFAYSGNSAV
jgi:SAM-dependent methyltransferase